MIDDASLPAGPQHLPVHRRRPVHGVWLRELAERLGLKAWVKPSTDQLHNVAVQGPESREIMKKLVWKPPTQPARGFKPFRFLVGASAASTEPRPRSRTRYTGELGDEVFGYPDDGCAVWDAVGEAGGATGSSRSGWMRST